MSVPFSRIASQALEAYDKRLYNNLTINNGVIAIFGKRGRIRFQEGGRDYFNERVLFGKNTNVGFISKNEQIDTNAQEGQTMARVPQRIIAGSVIINLIELAQVRGFSALGNLMEDAMQQAEITYVQAIAEAILQAAPGAKEPYTLLPSATSGDVPGILQAAAYASQNGTTAGINRSENTWWRNNYYNTAIDISSEGGDAALFQNLYSPCVKGSQSREKPDFGLCDKKTLGDLGAKADTYKRGSLADAGANIMGHTTTKYYTADLIEEVDGQMENKIALLNTNYLMYKVLRTPGMSKWDQENGLGSLPVTVGSFQRDIDSLNKVALFHAVFNLVPTGLRQHGLADNIT